MAAITTIKLKWAVASPTIERPIHHLVSSTPICPPLHLFMSQKCNLPRIVSCLSSSQPPSATRVSSSSKLFISGLSFRTTEESLTNAFVTFGQPLEVNLVMDKIAKRPKGYAFIRYATVEESQKAIQGMHGKFLDGRVIFVEVAKPRSQEKNTQKPGSTHSLMQSSFKEMSKLLMENLTRSENVTKLIYTCRLLESILFQNMKYFNVAWLRLKDH